MKIESPCTTACYGIQANFASIRVLGEMPDGYVFLRCSGAIPDHDFSTHFPLMEWMPVENHPGIYEVRLSSGRSELQKVLSFRIMAKPGTGDLSKKLKIWLRDSPDVNVEIDLIRGSGFNDIFIDAIDIGETSSGFRQSFSTRVENKSDYPLELTAIEFNNSNVTTELKPVTIPAKESQNIPFIVSVKGVYDVKNLCAKFFYNIDRDEQEYGIVSVKSTYKHVFDTGNIGIRVPSITDLDNLKTKVVDLSSGNGSIYIGIGKDAKADDRITVPIRIDNGGRNTCVIDDIKYSSGNTDIELISSHNERLIVEGDEAKTIGFDFRVNKISGFGVGIISFTVKSLSPENVMDLKESFKVSVSWGKNG